MATDKPRSIVTYVHRPMRPTIITVVECSPNALQRAVRSWDVLHPIPVPCFRAVREGEGSEPMRPTIITVVARTDYRYGIPMLGARNLPLTGTADWSPAVTPTNIPTLASGAMTIRPRWTPHLSAMTKAALTMNRHAL